MTDTLIEQANTDDVQIDEWSLTVDQMVYMLNHNNVIEAAFETDDDQVFQELMQSDEFLAVFGSMSFDEAYDRYETSLKYNDEN